MGPMILNVLRAQRLTADDTYMEDDTASVIAAQRGSVDAFERLYRRHVGRIYGLCLRIAGNAPDAEDWTQEAFVRAWEKLQQFRGASAFGTWLHRIAVNLALTRLRTQSLRWTWEAAPEPPEYAASTTGDSEKPDPGVRMDLDEAIASLPRRARAVFVLHDVEGYQHGEIAAQMGIAVGASRAHLHKARKLLRERIQR